MANRVARTRIGNIRIKDGVGNPMRLNDGLANVLSGLGTGVDQNSYSFYTRNILDQYQIENSYKTSWLSAKVHDIIPTDMVRAGWSYKADDADITKIEAEERRLNVKAKLRKAEFISDLYGGSAIMIGAGDADTRKPLDVNSVKVGGLQYLHVLSRYQINVPNLILDPGSPLYGQPDMYQVNAGNGALVDVHPSRIVRFINSDLPDEMLWENQGWSDPKLLRLWSAIVNADTAQGSFAALLNKAQVDTLAIPGLTQSISTTEGENALKKRAIYTKLYESAFSVKLIDSGSNGDGEEWTQYSPTWTGIPEIMRAYLDIVAAAADIPVTRMLGVSPAGMSATGLSDAENYDKMISAGQELRMRPRHEMINEVLYRSALGKRPADIWLQYNPLRTDSEETKAKNAKARAEASAIYVDKQLVPDEVMQEAVKGQLIESGEYPGIERAYIDYAEGNLLPIIEQEDEPPADPLIPVDPTTGLPTQNRESRLFAANDMAGKMVTAGMSVTDAYKEVLRLTDAEPRPCYVARYLTNGDEVKAHFEAQGLKVTVAPDRMHTTLIYSKTPIDWFKVAPTDWGDEAKLIVPAGGPRMMAKFGPNENAIVLMFASSRMSWRHEEFIREGASYDFEYQPHLTLNYEGQDIDLTTIKPYQGELRFGYERFEEIREDWAK